MGVLALRAAVQAARDSSGGYLPSGTCRFPGSVTADRSEVTRLARAAGLAIIDLSPAFDSVTDPHTLMIAKWDHHITARGHRLLADKLYKGLVPSLFGSSH